jgi:hypothetical protein
VVFDKGNNSKEGFESFTATPFHFVGSLVPSQHPDLLAIPHRKFRTLTSERLEGVEVYRTQKKVFGTIPCAGHLQPHLLEGQRQGLLVNLRKARPFARTATLLQRRREGKIKRGKALALEAVKRQVRSLCSAQFLAQILKVEVKSVHRGHN